jgi:hypothetical protein
MTRSTVEKRIKLYLVKFWKGSLVKNIRVCVCLTSSRGRLPSDAVLTTRQIHPPQCLQRHTPSRLRTSASP